MVNKMTTHVIHWYNFYGITVILIAQEGFVATVAGFLWRHLLKIKITLWVRMIVKKAKATDIIFLSIILI